MAMIDEEKWRKKYDGTKIRRPWLEPSFPTKQSRETPT
jgi:hypothetical protein